MINMDGTSIHHNICSIYSITFGQDLTLIDQVAIVLTATLSIGAAAVPGAGLIIVIVLGAIALTQA